MHHEILMIAHAVSLPLPVNLILIPHISYTLAWLWKKQPFILLHTTMRLLIVHTKNVEMSSLVMQLFTKAICHQVRATAGEAPTMKFRLSLIQPVGKSFLKARRATGQHEEECSVGSRRAILNNNKCPVSNCEQLQAAKEIVLMAVHSIDASKDNCLAGDN